MALKKVLAGLVLLPLIVAATPLIIVVTTIIWAMEVFKEDENPVLDTSWWGIFKFYYTPKL